MTIVIVVILYAQWDYNCISEFEATKNNSLSKKSKTNKYDWGIVEAQQ